MFHVKHSFLFPILNIYKEIDERPVPSSLKRNE